MGINDVITNQRSNDTPRDLLLTPSFGINILMPEHVNQELRPRGEDIPPSCEPDIHGAVFLQRLSEPAVVDVVLAHVAP